MLLVHPVQFNPMPKARPIRGYLTRLPFGVGLNILAIAMRLTDHSPWTSLLASFSRLQLLSCLQRHWLADIG